MDLTSSSILVTGADGFIGSHLTEALVRRGCRVRAFVLYNSFNSWGWLDQSPPEVKDAIDVFAGDIRDPHGVRQAVQGCDVVLHLAALIGIPYSYHSPDTYVDTNIKGTLNVLQAARELGVQKVVHTSTSEVYGSAQFVPITEEHPLQGQSPYSASKIGADQIALSFYRSFDTPVAVLRPFNTYGPRQSARAIIPTIISQALAGGEIRLGSLTPTRDLTYVADMAEAFIKIAESDGTCGRVFNAGSGFEISIGELAKKIGGLLGAELHIACDSERLRPEKSEVERLWADTTRAREVFGWAPAVSFEQGLERTICWIKENMHTFKVGAYAI